MRHDEPVEDREIGRLRLAAADRRWLGRRGKLKSGRGASAATWSAIVLPSPFLAGPLSLRSGFSVGLSLLGALDDLGVGLVLRFLHGLVRLLGLAVVVLGVFQTLRLLVLGGELLRRRRVARRLELLLAPRRPARTSFCSPPWGRQRRASPRAAAGAAAASAAPASAPARRLRRLGLRGFLLLRRRRGGTSTGISSTTGGICSASSLSPQRRKARMARWSSRQNAESGKARPRRLAAAGLEKPLHRDRGKPAPPAFCRAVSFISLEKPVSAIRVGRAGVPYNRRSLHARTGR